MIGYTAAGKRRFKPFYGKTQAEAKKKRNEFLRLMEAGMLVEKEYVFDEWADMWFDNHKDNISPTTQESYSYTLKILKDYFGRRKLKDIKAYDIEQLLKKLRRDGRSDSCLTQCRGMLYQIFNKAEANDLVLKDPVRFADKMRKGPKKRKESFTADEVKVLMEPTSSEQNRLEHNKKAFDDAMANLKQESYSLLLKTRVRHMYDLYLEYDFEVEYNRQMAESYAEV